MKTKLAFLVTLSGLVLLGIQTASSQEGQLTSPEIQKILAGSTVSGVSSDGKPWHKDYAANGDVRYVSVDNDIQNTDAGRWRVYENRLCETWAHLRNGLEQCWYVFHKEGASYTFKAINGDGDLSLEIGPTPRRN